MKVIGILVAVLAAGIFVRAQATSELSVSPSIDCSPEVFQKVEKEFLGRPLKGTPEKSLMTLVQACPEANWRQTAAEYLTTVQEERADSLIYLANYYQQKFEDGRSSTNLGAVTRFEFVLRNYPNYSRTDRALLLYGNALATSGRIEDARAAFTRLINEFPNSPLTDEAYTRSKSLDAR